MVMKILVEMAFEKCLDSKEKNRDASMKLFSELGKQKLLKEKHLTPVFDMHLEMVEDLAIDIPKVAEFLGTYIGR